MSICIVVPLFNSNYDKPPDPIIEVFYENETKDKVMMMRHECDLCGDVIGGRKYDVKKTYDMGDDGIFKAVKWRYQGEDLWTVIERRYW